MEYNWSDLDVGNRDLNHSEGYFGVSHLKHEKDFKEEKISQAANKENISTVKKEEAGPSINENAFATTNEEPNQLKKELITIKKTPKNLLKSAADMNAGRCVLKERSSSTQTKNFSVLKYTKIYEDKKKRIYNKIVEEEKKKRQFHSRSVPDFNKKKLPVAKPIPVTIPITPAVLKRESSAIRRRKLEELNKQYDGKFNAREAKVLYEEPFVPKKEPHCIQLQPFNLNVEKRLEQRKHYNEFYSMKLEEKKKQQEEEQRINDENLVKEIRKLTTFQARKNPFK